MKHFCCKMKHSKLKRYLINKMWKIWMVGLYSRFSGSDHFSPGGIPVLNSLPFSGLPYKVLVFSTLLIAASTWIHCTWYLLGLPVVCFFYSTRMACGHSCQLFYYYWNSIRSIVYRTSLYAFKAKFAPRNPCIWKPWFHHKLVGEFQSSRGDVLIVMVVSRNVGMA